MINQFWGAIKVQNYHLVIVFFCYSYKLTQCAVLRFVISIICVFVIGKAFRNETLIQY